MDEQGTFTLTYRLLKEGKPIYVNMKAIRTGSDSKHIIIGVSNVDAQMRQQETLERVKEERITYERITALSGEFICVYTVDPETDRYTEYSATHDYEGLGLEKQGEDFFNVSRKESMRLVYIEDLDIFKKTFTKENVLKIARKMIKK